MKTAFHNNLRAIPPAVYYLHVISSLDPEGGGPVEGVRQMCHTALQLGHRVEIATADAPDAPWRAEIRCPVHQLGPGRFGKYRFAPDLYRWLAANARRFDAIIVNGLWQHHGFATWRALRGGNTPYFVFTHGMLDPWFKHRYPLKHLKKWLYWPWGEYRVLRDARAVLFTSEEERLLARRSFGLYRAKEAVVGYGTPGPSGDASAQKEAFLGTYPELRDRRLVTFLGRIHPKKGCDLLVDAFRHVRDRDPRLHLLMAGPGPADWLAELRVRAEQAGIGNRITWTGMLRGDLKWGALHASEVFVLPSHQENFGIAVAEALACGVPVLISDKVNIWREIHDDKAGLAAPDTRAGTCDLLRRWILLSENERKQFAHNAAQSFQRRFHISAATRSLLTTMESHGVIPMASG